MTPRISVVMAVHNGGSFLATAIESILRQSEGCFEFLIVDDGSIDDSAAIVQGFGDSRIKLIRNETNQGLAASLNVGLAQARGTYVARLDADDIAMPRRFALQANFLDVHPEIGLLGSNAILVDEHCRRLYRSENPCSPLAVRWWSLLQNPFIHSTVMLRRDVLERHSLRYDAQMSATQDYELWLRVLEKTEGANLEVPTVFQRIHGASISSRKAEIQRTNTLRLTGAAIRRHFRVTVVETSDRTAILDAIFGSRHDAIAGEMDRVYAAHRYYDLLHAFLRHNPAGCIAECKRRASTRVVRMALYPPVSKGWLRLFLRSLKIDPFLPLHFLRFIAFRLAQRVKRGRRIVLPAARSWS